MVRCRITSCSVHTITTTLPSVQENSISKQRGWLQHAVQCWRESADGSPELFLIAHELDQCILIRLTPLQLHWGAIHHFWLQEQTPGLFVQPVLWRRVLLQEDQQNTHTKNQDQTPLYLNGWTSKLQQTSTYAGVNVFKDLLNAAMLFDQVDGSLWANPLDGAAVVTAQQNTQVYELGWTTERRKLMQERPQYSLHNVPTPTVFMIPQHTVRNNRTILWHFYDECNIWFTERVTSMIKVILEFDHIENGAPDRVMWCTFKRTNCTCSLVRPMSCSIRLKWNSWIGSFLKQKKYLDGYQILPELVKQPNNTAIIKIKHVNCDKYFIQCYCQNN